MSMLFSPYCSGMVYIVFSLNRAGNGWSSGICLSYIMPGAKLISPYQWTDNSGTNLIWYASISLKSRQWTMKRSSDFAWKRGTTLELYNYSYEKPDVLIKISQRSHFSWRHGFHLLILFNWDHGINETLYSWCYVEFNYVSVRIRA